MLRAIAEMARRMGLETVAEGVENGDQQRFVVDAGVSGVQGYLHLRPVPAAELTAWLAEVDQRASAGVAGA